MSSSFERYQKRKLISSYISVVMSISLVLFLLGALGLLVLNTQRVANHFKEQIAFTVYLKDNAKEVEIRQLQNSLAMAPYTKDATYVSKEEAAESLSEDIGEDFMEFLGYNPLQNSIDMHLKARFVTTDSIQRIADEMMAKNFVEEVVYDQPLIDLLNENIRRIGLWILVACGVFTLIAVLLINSSIRLAVYSKRFIIKTMQMVGATKSFIRRPFIWKHVRLGILGALLAIIGMGVLLYYSDNSFPELNLLQDPIYLGILFLSILVLGVLITWVSTFIATQRFLNLRTDDLYY